MLLEPVTFATTPGFVLADPPDPPVTPLGNVLSPNIHKVLALT